MALLVFNRSREVLLPATVRLLARTTPDVLLSDLGGKKVMSNRLVLSFFSNFLANIINLIPTEESCVIILPFDFPTVQTAVKILHAGFGDEHEITEEIRELFILLGIMIPSKVSSENTDEIVELVNNGQILECKKETIKDVDLPFCEESQQNFSDIEEIENGEVTDLDYSIPELSTKRKKGRPCKLKTMTMKTYKKEMKLNIKADKKMKNQNTFISCEECGKQVKIWNPNSWNHHLRKHVAEKFKCDCMASVASWQAKERHRRLVHEGWIACPTCAQPVQDEEALEEHKKKHDEKIGKEPKEIKRRAGTKYPRICPDCGETFSNNTRQERVKFKEHQSKHAIENVKCDCDLIFKSFQARTRHVRVHHLGWFACELCIAIFKDKTILDAHLIDHKIPESKVNEKQYECEYCGITKSDIGSMKYHRRMVHEMEFVKCDICLITLKHPMHLKAHMRNKHLKTPVSCQVCLKSVKNLKIHMENMHTPDSEKKFKCDSCPKGFTEPSRLKSHQMNVHIKSRPYACRYPPCEMAYNDLSNRNSHEKRTHLQENVFI